MANGVPDGLSISIYTADVTVAFQAIAEITTGLVYINAGTTDTEIQLSFGGTRQTGKGHREAGRATLDVYSEWKTVFVDHSAACSGPRSD